MAETTAPTPPDSDSFLAKLLDPKAVVWIILPGDPSLLSVGQDMHHYPAMRSHVNDSRACWCNPIVRVANDGVTFVSHSDFLH